MSNRDRAAVIDGLIKMTLGSDGVAVALLHQLERSMEDQWMTSHPTADPQTWAQCFAHMKNFETAVKASAQVDDWMTGKRSKWMSFCDNVDNQHPAGFATAVLALDISIKGDCQVGSWCGGDRSGWVARCRECGAVDFDWDSSNFVCSGLDGCEVLLDSVARSIPNEHLSSAFAAGDYKTYGSLFEAVKRFECCIKASAQEDSWMSDKRAKWIRFCDNSANHTPTGFATAVLALDLSVPGSNNVPGWCGPTRDSWVQRCRNAGATNFDWS
jgi:hypothetical protein